MKLTTAKGEVVLVDRDVYREWRHRSVHLTPDGYVQVWHEGHTRMLHRVILGATKSQRVDHKDGNKQDCRRDNLRFCTTWQNACNSRHKPGRSGYRGVFHAQIGNGWSARIIHKRRQVYLGTYDTPEEAARIWNAFAKWYRGKFAVLNKI